MWKREKWQEGALCFISLVKAHCPHHKGRAFSPPALAPILPSVSHYTFLGRHSAKPLQRTDPGQESPHFAHFSFLLAARYFLSTAFLHGCSPSPAPLTTSGKLSGWKEPPSSLSPGVFWPRSAVSVHYAGHPGSSRAEVGWRECDPVAGRVG